MVCVLASIRRLLAVHQSTPGGHHTTPRHLLAVIIFGGRRQAVTGSTDFLPCPEVSLCHTRTCFHIDCIELLSAAFELVSTALGQPGSDIALLLHAMCTCAAEKRAAACRPFVPCAARPGGVEQHHFSNQGAAPTHSSACLCCFGRVGLPLLGWLQRHSRDAAGGARCYCAIDAASGGVAAPPSCREVLPSGACAAFPPHRHAFSGSHCCCRLSRVTECNL